MVTIKRPGGGGEGETTLNDKSAKELVSELEEKMERLRVLFEQYFLGIEKRPPFPKKSEIQRIIRHLQTKRINQTAVRFQFQALVGRFNIFDTYWTRILRKIEDGTYERDLFKAKLREQLSAERPAAPGAASPAPAAGSPAAQAPAPEAAPASQEARPSEAPEPSPTAPSPPAAPEPGYGLAEERLRKVYDDYVEARRRTGEPVEGLSYEKIRATLVREAPKIAEKNRVSRVDFEVVIRDGRAVLKAVPIKGGE